ncbi:hypothetical protein M2R48_14155 [Acinetobacter sp. I-MWF]|uniref:hypothetical protein n=1 Tax=Acinetobacter sp. I-MWF TaxID=2940517 RepID=UPI0021C8C256|nr:hypothetical protein [Acinetobacter sp. I-MWF]MCT9979477.1 hypothetical protein [Acinetobacter sp. I-MWF]
MLGWFILCRAGEKCPQSGYWFTVAQANSRRYFVPDIKSDWGDVYWQFGGDE